jgi:nucleotide-binding universal stress UspA family protein
MLLGSVSNYLIQKSSSPVMVTRRPLRVSRTVHRKLSTLNREARTSLARAQTEKESKGGAVEEPAEPSDIHEQVEKMTVHDAGPSEEVRSSVEGDRPEPPKIVEPEGTVDPEASSVA